MKHLNKEPDDSDSRIHRVGVKIHRWMTRNGRTVRDQMVRGAAYGVGSGAVSLGVFWIQLRR